MGDGDCDRSGMGTAQRNEADFLHARAHRRRPTKRLKDRLGTIVAGRKDLHYYVDERTVRHFQQRVTRASNLLLGACLPPYPDFEEAAERIDRARLTERRYL